MHQVAELIGPNGPEDDKPREVSVAGHSLKAKFSPHIVIELGKFAEIRKLPIPVTFALEVEGLLITVTNRRIVGVLAGRANPSVTVAVDDVTIFKEKLPTIDLPLEMKPESEGADVS
jgi:hypothetical protein